jgi:hypothetical protein
MLTLGKNGSSKFWNDLIAVSMSGSSVKKQCNPNEPSEQNGVASHHTPPPSPTTTTPPPPPPTPTHYHHLHHHHHLPPPISHHQPPPPTTTHQPPTTHLHPPPPPPIHHPFTTHPPRTVCNLMKNNSWHIRTRRETTYGKWNRNDPIYIT